MEAIDPKKVGARVKALREACGYGNQKAFAVEQLGIRQPSLSDIETGVTKEISGPVLARLCLATKTTAEYVIFGAGQDRDSNEVSSLIAEATHLIRATSGVTRDALMRSIRAIAQAEHTPKSGKATITDSRVNTDVEIAGQQPNASKQPVTKPIGVVTEGNKPRGNLDDTSAGNSFPTPAPPGEQSSGGKVRRKGDLGKPDRAG